jgi:hypothetical protein
MVQQAESGHGTTPASRLRVLFKNSRCLHAKSLIALGGFDLEAIVVAAANAHVMAPIDPAVVSERGASEHDERDTGQHELTHMSCHSAANKLRSREHTQ